MPAVCLLIIINVYRAPIKKGVYFLLESEDYSLSFSFPSLLIDLLERNFDGKQKTSLLYSIWIPTVWQLAVVAFPNSLPPSHPKHSHTSVY